MSKRKGLWFLAGGNPPHNPGLYFDDRIIAFWPIGLEPTEQRSQNIYRLWCGQPDRKRALSETRVREELIAAGLAD